VSYPSVPFGWHGKSILEDYPMKPRTQTAIAVCLMLLAFAADYVIAAPAADYYPVHQGNYWTIRSEPTGGGRWEPAWIYRYAKGVEDINGLLYVKDVCKKIQDIGGVDLYMHTFWLRIDQGRNIMAGAVAGDSAELNSAVILDPPAAFYTNEMFEEGYVWEVDWGDEHWECECLNCTSTVVVPAGTFSDCCVHRIVKTDIATGDTVHIKREFFAKGAGIVQEFGDAPAERAYINELHEYGIETPSLSALSLAALIACLAAVAIWIIHRRRVLRPTG
jgi:hypothetical protein